MSNYNPEPGEQRWTQAEQVSELTRTTSAVGVTTNNQAVVTCATANFTADDVGRAISGTNIPAGTYIKSVTSATAAVMTQNATATATTTAFTIAETAVGNSGDGTTQITSTENATTGGVKSFRFWPIAGRSIAGEARVRF